VVQQLNSCCPWGGRGVTIIKVSTDLHFAYIQRLGEALHRPFALAIQIFRDAFLGALGAACALGIAGGLWLF
jgi:hypothetical protein